MIPTSIFQILFGLALCFQVVTARQLRAQAKPSALRSRSLGLRPEYQTNDFLYVDEASPYTESSFAASLSFSPSLPVLVLDDVEEHFSHISCSRDAIDMHFVSIDQMQAAQSSWSDSSIFLVVTSHTACVDDGSHRPFVVKSVTFAPENRIATLYVEETSFKSSSNSMHLEFGKSVYKRYISRQIEARAANPPLTSTIPPKTAYPSATGTPTAQSISTSFQAAYTNAAILPPDSAIAHALTSLLPVPAGIELLCKNCTLLGSLELAEGSIDYQKGSNTFESIEDFVKSGYVTFAVNGLDAHIELELELQGGLANEQFNAQLPPIAIPGLSIPGVGAIGPLLELGIFMGVQLDSAINFTTGFELSVPTGSSLTFNISEIGSSTVTGFEDTAFNGLPFQMSSTPPKVSFFAGLLPQLVLGFSAFDNEISGGVGAFMNLPKLSVSVGEVSGVNLDCQPTPTNALPGTQFLVKESAVLNIGVEENLNFTSPIIPNEAGSQVLTSKKFTLGSQCLMFDSGSSSLVTAHSPTPTHTTSALPSSTSGSGSGSGIFTTSHQGAAPTLHGSRMAIAACLLAWVSGWMIICL